MLILRVCTSAKYCLYGPTKGKRSVEDIKKYHYVSFCLKYATPISEVIVFEQYFFSFNSFNCIEFQLKEVVALMDDDFTCFHCGLHINIIVISTNLRIIKMTTNFLENTKIDDSRLLLVMYILFIMCNK